MNAPALSIRDEAGQTMAEYGVVLALIAVVTVAIFTSLGNSIEGAITLVTGLFT
jgi:Flp pilus assembly pilin Flp